MTKDEVLEVVTHTGDCYRVKCKGVDEPFNLYVTKIGDYFLEQKATDLEFHVVDYHSIEWVRLY